ncbi:hypothetical protein AAFJ72_20870 [Brevibacillus gelatini]|uniref:hypothetical protein n=1 Tax=Brevibacillus gelatini TaxID=1655277 RepID=UPI003D81BADE
MTGYERIRVTAPYRIKRIEDVRMEWKPNEHAQLYLRGIVDDSETVNAVLQAASDDEIRLYDTDGESETTIFKGVVTSVQIAHRQGVYAIELEGQSGSFQLDVTNKRRSFQQAGMTYPKLVQEIIKTYPGYNVNVSIGEGIQIGEPIIQYDETDWELLKRLASHKKLTLNAKEEISLYTPKRVVIQAQSQILAKKTSASSGFALESESVGWIRFTQSLELWLWPTIY